MIIRRQFPVGKGHRFRGDFRVIVKLDAWEELHQIGAPLHGNFVPINIRRPIEPDSGLHPTRGRLRAEFQDVVCEMIHKALAILNESFRLRDPRFLDAVK